MFLIVYDVADGGRLRRVAKVCEDYGVRIQKSVFECDLDASTFQRFWSLLVKALDAKFDSLVAYPLCSSCLDKVKTAGVVHREAPSSVYVA